MSILILLTALFSQVAFPAGEVMLMVNMNYSLAELDAAKSVARNRGQELVLVPPEEDMRPGDNASQARTKLKKELQKIYPDYGYNEMTALLDNVAAYGAGVLENPAAREKIKPAAVKYQAAAREIQEIEKKRERIDVQISAKLSELKAAGKTVDSLIISGHSNGSAIFGETDHVLTQKEIMKLRSDHPEAFLRARHVMLLGCYTTTEIARVSWREIFPNATLIAGFDGQSPGRYLKESRDFVTGVLGTADRLDKENFARSAPHTKEVVDKALRALESVRNTNSAIDYCTYGIEGIAKRKAKCDDQWLTYPYFRRDIEARFLGPDATEEPLPGGQGPLRAFYTSLQQLCPVENATVAIPPDRREEFKAMRIHDKERTLRLLFWGNVQKNYGVYHAKEIKELEARMKAAGVVAPLPNLDGLQGRKKFLSEVKELVREISKKREVVNEDPKPELELAEILADLQLLYEPLFYLSAEAIPHNWVEAGTASARR